MQTVLTAKEATFTTLRTMNIELPKVGVFISNQVKEKDARLLTLISSMYGHLSLKEAYTSLMRVNKGQTLKSSPNMAYGRSATCIWFAYCDDQGKLHTQLPVAALFFKENN